jgi:hypothetical protein
VWEEGTGGEAVTYVVEARRDHIRLRAHARHGVKRNPARQRATKRDSKYKKGRSERLAIN